MKNTSKSTSTYSALGAIGSIVAATSCCLPIGVLSLAAGAAGTSAVLNALRPYLMTLSVLLIAFGFWQMHRAKKCACKTSRWSTVLLWSAAVFVGFSIAFPQVLADLLAG